MTPYQFRLCIEAHRERETADHNHAVYMMYYGAALTRVKKMPPVDTFLIKNEAPKPEVKGYDESAIIARLNKYQAKRDLRNARNRKTKR